VIEHVAPIVLIALLAGCSGSGTSPTDPQTQQPHGRLSGTVTIGPNCPGPTTTNPCPTPPEAYAQRKILIYDTTKTRLLFTAGVDSQGLYTILLLPGRYTVDLKPNGIDRTNDLPKSVTIVANGTVVVNVSIDTGLR
jgi:hypothetical protein